MLELAVSGSASCEWLLVEEFHFSGHDASHIPINCTFGCSACRGKRGGELASKTLDFGDT